jgi:hypothetical protein
MPEAGSGMPAMLYTEIKSALTAIEFTPFGHSFSEEKCSRIGS